MKKGKNNYGNFNKIMKSNINALLDKCEDPAKMIDQTLRDLREDLAEVKKETANIIADAKSADRQVKECEEEITKYTTAAQNALKAGNENDARTLIANNMKAILFHTKKHKNLLMPMLIKCVKCMINLLTILKH